MSLAPRIKVLTFHVLICLLPPPFSFGIFFCLPPPDDFILFPLFSLAPSQLITPPLPMSTPLLPALTVPRSVLFTPCVCSRGYANEARVRRTFEPAAGYQLPPCPWIAPATIAKSSPLPFPRFQKDPASEFFPPVLSTRNSVFFPARRPACVVIRLDDLSFSPPPFVDG